MQFVLNPLFAHFREYPDYTIHLYSESIGHEKILVEMTEKYGIDIFLNPMRQKLLSYYNKLHLFTEDKNKAKIIVRTESKDIESAVIVKCCKAFSISFQFIFLFIIFNSRSFCILRRPVEINK